MNQTHVHLLITHLPIFGSILGAFVLIHGIWKKSGTTLIAAYNILIISAIGAGIAYATGEGAEDTVESIHGVSKSIIDEHSESALVSLIALIAAGALSFIGLIVTLKGHSLTRPVALVTLFVSLTGFGLVARTGYLGGQIRHSEIGTTAVSSTKEGDYKGHSYDSIQLKQLPQ